MKKRLLSLFLAFVTLLGILPTAALAANTEEEALGEVDIYNGGYELSYLTINGRIRTQDYTYFNYVDAKGQKKEVPAYCVNPNIKGVPQTVGVGESIKYLANERSSDPKVVASCPVSICIRRVRMVSPWAASPIVSPKSRTAPGIWTAPLPAQVKSAGRAWSRAFIP